jgi:hypothetical protein
VRDTGGRGLPLTNLLNDLRTLCPLLVNRVAAEDLLNAFLLAAGIQQIADDHLHRAPSFLGRAASRTSRRLPGPWGRIGSTLARTAGDLLWQRMVRTRGHLASVAWLSDLEGLVQRLAAGLMETAARDASPRRPELQADAEALVSRLPWLPASLHCTVLRPPSCFRSFDQAPEDLEALAGAFARRWPEPERPLLVVGVRSSGCYLAPLVAASLGAHGFRDVRVATMRPGQRWLRRESLLVERTAGRGGLALLVDDPPRSWGSVTRAARDLAGRGFARRDIVLLLATFADAAEPPAALGEHPAVLLPFTSWAVWRRLQPDCVRESLARLLARQVEVVAVPSPTGLPAGTRRGHAQAVYEVACGGAGETERRLVRARGVGLGYFGEHALAVADRLGGRVTDVHGLEAGILYETWAPPDARLAGPLAQRHAVAVAAYVAERGRALRLDEDPSSRLHSRGPAWQWAGQALGGLFGCGSELGRPLSGAVARRLLTVAEPAVIDNRTELDAFAIAPDGKGLVKCDFDLGVFTDDDFCCFDPVSDVALAAVGDADAATGDRLRRAYEAAAGRPVDPERWLLYQLVHVLVSQEKERPEVRHVDPRPARLLQRYYGEVLVGGPGPVRDGPLCAIDVDGVLETMPPGFPATGPAGALALRALVRHGFRPVLATGHSLEEVRDRCAAYGLAGGVAEYGTALHVREGGRVHALLEPAAIRALELLRATLAEARDVFFDPAHRHSVRAFRLDARGRRRGLPAELVSEALAASGTAGWLRAVPGHQQTDFVPTDASKERALRLLARELGVDGGTPLAPTQTGLAESVGRLVGHRPGRCAVCAPPPLSGNSRLLLDLLAMQDLSPWRQACRGLRLLAFRIPD